MQPLVGQIMLFGGNYAPRGWALCDGQLLTISENPALYAVLGTTHGGDGRHTFAVPDLRKPEQANLNYIIAIDGEFPQRT